MSSDILEFYIEKEKRELINTIGSAKYVSEDQKEAMIAVMEDDMSHHKYGGDEEDDWQVENDEEGQFPRNGALFHPYIWDCRSFPPFFPSPGGSGGCLSWLR